MSDSDNVTTDAPVSDEPHPNVADADAPAGAGGPAAVSGEAPERAEPAGGSAATTTDDWSSVPAVEAEPKKPKSQAPKAEAAPEDEEAADVDEGTISGAEAVADPDEGPTDIVEPTEPPPPENKKKWYAIKVQSGREDTIKAAILRKVAIEGLEDVFGQILVPVDKVTEKRAVKVKDKKTGEYTTVERKVERKVKKFQGYIFAELEFNDRMLYLIRETSGVGDFLKLRNKKDELPIPEPMTDAEVKQMLGEKVGPDTGSAKKVVIEFEKGDRVRIKEGSFKDSEGDVKEVILPKDPTDPPKVIVIVTFWGRPLDVELEYWQVTKA
ncbi:MAG TPA: transcription termination/antitermination protein NusG [Gemmata sp.]